MNIKVYLRHCTEKELLDLSNMVDLYVQIRNVNRHVKLVDTLLSTKTLNPLIREGLETLGQVSDMSVKELLEIRGIGGGARLEIDNVLKHYGMKLKDS